MAVILRAANGAGLAAPQIGESLQLAVIEDRAEYIQSLPAEIAAERERVPVPFHVIINPQLTIAARYKCIYVFDIARWIKKRYNLYFVNFQWRFCG